MPPITRKGSKNKKAAHATSSDLTDDNQMAQDADSTEPNAKKRTRSTSSDLIDEPKINSDLDKLAPLAKRPANNFYGRAETSQHVTSLEGLPIKAPMPIRPLKTSILLHPHAFSSDSDSGTENTSESEMARELEEGFKQVESYRAIKRIITRTPGGTPSSVSIEGDIPGEEETLILSSHLGSAVIFSNNPALKPVNLKPVTTICSSNPVLNRDALAKVTPAVGISKTQATTITQKSLEQTKRENKSRSKRRVCSQNKAVAAPNIKESEASASKYAKFIEISREQVSWEWLHLIAHQILGEESQTAENLVAGTNHANTEMLLIIEQHIKLIADAYPDGFELSTKAELISKNVQLSNRIHYTIITPDFKLPLIFNARTENKPHTDYGQYFKVFIETLLKHANAKNLASSSDPVTSRSTTPNILPPFFTPKPIPKKPEKANTTSIITPTKKSGVDRLAKQGAEKTLQINHPSYDSVTPPPSRPATPSPETEEDLASKLGSPSRGLRRR